MFAWKPVCLFFCVKCLQSLVICFFPIFFAFFISSCLTWLAGFKCGNLCQGELPKSDKQVALFEVRAVGVSCPVYGEALCDFLVFWFRTSSCSRKKGVSIVHSFWQDGGLGQRGDIGIGNLLSWWHHLEWIPDGISRPLAESEHSESITPHVGVSHPPQPHWGRGVTALRRASGAIKVTWFLWGWFRVVSR